MIDDFNGPDSETNRKAWEVLPNSFKVYDLSYKIIIIGDAGVGKSSLTNRATKNVFEEKYKATVGFDFCLFNIRINDKVLRLHIWDTCGQDTYRSLITSYFKNASLAIIVYSITKYILYIIISQESFDNLDVWLKELRLHSTPDTKVFLIGNKNDLEDKRVIPKQKGEQFALDYQLHYFMETSAKSGYQASDLFIEIARMLYKNWLDYGDQGLKAPSDFHNTLRTSLKRNSLKGNKSTGCNC